MENEFCYLCEDTRVDHYCEYCGKGVCDHHIDQDGVCVECSDELSGYDSEVIDDSFQSKSDDEEIDDEEFDEYNEQLEEFDRVRVKKKTHKCESCNRKAEFQPDLDAHLCDAHAKMERENVD